MTCYYDRRALPSFVGVFEHGGLSKLPELARSDRWIWDIHFRRKAPSTLSYGASTFTIYAGMGAILSISRNRSGWAAESHSAYRQLTSWPTEAEQRQPLESLSLQADRLVDFVRNATEMARTNRRFVAREGLVHAAFAAGVDRREEPLDGLRLIDHEASVGFESRATSAAWWDSFHDRLRSALKDAVHARWWPPELPRGSGCDFLCTDGTQLFAVEAKPADELKGITEGPLQVRAYAELFAGWIAGELEHVAIIEGMIDQRHRVGFGGSAVEVRPRLQVVPVLLVGDGDVTAEAVRRAQIVARAADAVRSPGVAPMQWWRVDRSGRVTDWRPE